MKNEIFCGNTRKKFEPQLTAHKALSFCHFFTIQKYIFLVVLAKSNMTISQNRNCKIWHDTTNRTQGSKKKLRYVFQEMHDLVTPKFIPRIVKWQYRMQCIISTHCFCQSPSLKGSLILITIICISNGPKPSKVWLLETKFRFRIHAFQISKALVRS